MKRLHLKLFLTMLVVFGFIALLSPDTTYAATFTVTKTADTNDGTCDSDCSFREAIVAANANPGHDTINFNIPESDGGYVAPSGDVHGYFTLNISSAVTSNDVNGISINGYSQSGAQRNTASFGETNNAILKIRIVSSSFLLNLNNTNDNYITGVNGVNTNQNSITGNTSNNWFEGNYFGTDITGNDTNDGWGAMYLPNGSNNTIGTNGDGIGDIGEMNIVSTNNGGNNGSVYIDNGDGNVVAGNYFGTDKSGRTCGAGLQRRHHIYIRGNNNRVGTNLNDVSDSEESNIISCINTDARSTIRIAGGSGTLIQGNYIGTNPYGDDLQSFFSMRSGVVDNDTITNTIIRRNVIANHNYGIYFAVLGSTHNTISQNSIHSTTNGLGIGHGFDLVNPVPQVNDPGDLDTGINDLMNYPVMHTAGLSGSNLLVTAQLDFNPLEAPYTLEFFNNSELHASGHGPGETYLGSVTTSQTGNNVALTIPLADPLPTDITMLTATATNANGSTSEFSAAPQEIVEYQDFGQVPNQSNQSNPAGTLADTGTNQGLLTLLASIVSLPALSFGALRAREKWL